MAAFGETIANHLLPGHPIALTGHVGVGKSFLSRVIIQNIIGLQDVPSPTFTLVQTYETEGYDIWHTDLYRLTAIDQVDELGLWDALRDDVCLIEWPELIREHLPSTTLHIEITMPKSTDTRQLTLRSADPHWAPLMDYKND
ncbi:MAG: tRNA (adenosine(37)-N6)-threonylcarbamoyltransferase complex ATPase subunit type 1 TsaE [Planktomarina sp.]